MKISFLFSKLRKIIFFVVILFYSSTIFAQTKPIETNVPHLKNLFAEDFDFGCLLSYAHVGFPTDPTVPGQSSIASETGGDLIKYHMNSMSPGNWMKSTYIVDIDGSASAYNNASTREEKDSIDVNPIVTFNGNIIAQLNWAQRQGFKFRGHTLVWHNQNPGTAFFRSGYTTTGERLSKEQMTLRLENFIKEVFRTIHESWPGLLVAMDVVNEAVNDNGTDRKDNNEWYTTFGDNSFIMKAFEFSRKYTELYGETQIKLYYNDYNTHIASKADGIVRICKPIYEAGFLDGLGMQDHDQYNSPTAAQWIATYDKFYPICDEITVTELDVKPSSSTLTDAVLNTQANQYAMLFKCFLDRSYYSGKGKLITVAKDGLNDELAFVKNASLWDEDNQCKPAFFAVAKLAQNYKAINSIIAASDTLTENNYTSASWSVYTSALASAQEAMVKNYSQNVSAADAIANAKGELENAIYNLKSVTSGDFTPDPNFHIYLAFGQSNMEGQGTIEDQDLIVDSRFKVMEAVNCSGLDREKGNWYTAIPPLCRCYTGLSPVDYFGRTMVENLPDSIKVGVINVSVAGCKIELFNENSYEDYLKTSEDWLVNIANEYGGNPYQHLVDMAKLAQQDGIIKGILLHQGESNTGDAQWPSKVKAIYDSLLSDLNLEADSIPLLAGEVVNADQGGVCASMNTIIAELPRTIPNSYVISSSKCTDAADNLHFNSAGYRKFGTRYAKQMLSLMGIEITDPVDPEPEVGTYSVFYEAECESVGEDWEVKFNSDASNGSYVEVKAGIESPDQAAPESTGAIFFTFNVDSTGEYSINARLNCGSYDDDSFWIKMDNDDYAMINGLVTSGWQWLKLNDYTLEAGEHTLSITYREDGAKLDKINISNYPSLPENKGDEALNICDVTDVEDVNHQMPTTYLLQQNYPNPFNPTTNIGYQLKEGGFVNLTIYDVLGRKVATLVNENKKSGYHQVSFNAQSLGSGMYIYQIKCGSFTASRKMLLAK